ncbi:MAG: hypothetical protein ACLFWG_00175 [Longimicrobiales bacterium]
MPCACEREEERGRGYRRRNSELVRYSRLRSRSWSERRTVLRHGPVWETVRLEPCIWLLVDPGHECRRSVRGGHTAHHLGRSDLDGLVPAGGLVHDRLHGRPGEPPSVAAAELLEATGLTLEEHGRRHVERAVRRLRERGELPDAVLREALARGILREINRETGAQR